MTELDLHACVRVKSHTHARISVQDCNIHFFKKKASKKKNMCLYPRFIKNRKYLAKDIKGKTKPMTDERTKYVPIGCGNCKECRQQKANAWRIRLHEELKVWQKAYFITLTFSNENLQKLINETNSCECNGIATIAVRRFLERWRKKNGKSIKHWLITELGHENTERIHLHGILFTNEDITEERLSQIWSYGKIHIGNYCNKRTINYIVKYVTKIDTDHKGYKATILCSQGLGKNYITETTKIKHTYRPRNTIEYYTLNNGVRVNLPIYYRNHFFTPAQREALWIEKLDMHRKYVNGIECKNLEREDGYQTYERVIEQAQRDNEKIGYGSTANEWQKENYNITAKMLNYKKL